MELHRVPNAIKLFVVARFNSEALRVEGYTNSTALITIVAGLRVVRLLHSIGKREPTSYLEFITREQKYMKIEELIKSKAVSSEGRSHPN